MKNSFIEKVFLKNDFEVIATLKNEEYKKINEEFLKIIGELETVLPENRKDLADKVIEGNLALEAESSWLYFIEGVKAGLKLGAEAFCDE